MPLRGKWSIIVVSVYVVRLLHSLPTKYIFLYNNINRMYTEHLDGFAIGGIVMGSVVFLIALIAIIYAVLLSKGIVGSSEQLYGGALVTGTVL
jgi:hypothetical protein